MATPPPVLVIGATGVVGRPVVRVLHAAGVPVRVMARDPRRAAAAVPEGVPVVAGDLRSEDQVRRALAGCRAVFTAVSNPLRRSRPAFDPDREGTMTLLRAAAGLDTDLLVIRTSAMAVDRAADAWWAAANKVASDEAVHASQLRSAVLRPTWFIESLATTAIGPVLGRLPAPREARLSWLAGTDYGHLVAAILADPSRATGRTLDVHGAQEATMIEAVTAFAHVWRSFLRVMPIPRLALDAAAWCLEPPAYLGDLLDYTFEHVVKVPRDAATEAIHAPGIDVATCAADLLARGDLPAKRLGG